MLWQGWGLVASNFERAIPMIGVSESWRAAPLVISGVMIILFAGADMLFRIRHGEKHKA
jgi:TRAP-type C4-dicarboxylate transport system permease small subunit